MIGAVSHNTLLAVLLGPGIARTPGLEPSRGARIDAEREIQPEAYQVELSSTARALDPEDASARVARAPQFDDPAKQEVRELKQRDAEVRRHEAAHKSAAGPHASGGPTFQFQAGPDGKQYAVGGEVSIDTSEVAGDPAATIRKMQQVRRAALAPANPSAQDRAVAATAARLEQRARTQASQERSERAPQPGSAQTPYADASDEASRGLLMSVLA